MSGKPTYEELLERIKELEKEGSELHNAEKELQKSKAMLRAVVDSLPFDVFALDSYNRYFLQNSICMKNWGDVIGKYPENLPVNKETLNLWMDNNRRALSGETVVGEVEYNRLEGGKNFYYNIIAPIRDEEKIFGILGVLVDISDQKQAEEALRESEERYRSLAENSMVGFWQITLEGYTAYINPAMCSMIEIEGPEALSGQTYHSFFTPKSLETIDRERSKPLKGKGSSYEVVIVGKNGGRRNVVICGASLFSAEGELQGYIATFTDITARKRAENALQKAHNQLEHRVKERTRELEIKTNSLEEINTAMNILLKKREEDKKELEDNVLTNVKKLVEPYFEMIKKPNWMINRKLF